MVRKNFLPLRLPGGPAIGHPRMTSKRSRTKKRRESCEPAALFYSLQGDLNDDDCASSVD